jgi:hypothetical protein
MIVLQYNNNKINAQQVSNCFDLVSKSSPTEEVIAIPDGISLLELEDYELELLIKAWIEYAKLKGIDIKTLLKGC